MGSPARDGRSLALVLLLSVCATARADWEQKQPAVSPSAREGAAMAYDPVGGGIILFGGFRSEFVNHYQVDTILGDTWRWDGATWTQLSPAASPSPRAYHAMTLDVCRGHILLFGGAAGSLLAYPPPSALGDTWEWDGSTWVRLTPAHSPTPRWSTAMASDVRRRRTVLLGGTILTSTGPVRVAYSDTWEWNGSDWTQMASLPTVGPGDPVGLYAHALAYDPFRSRVVTIGGYGSSGGELWNWNGTRWSSDYDQSGGPVVMAFERRGPGWVYDANRGSVVLFGGISFDSYGGYIPPWASPAIDTMDWTGREFVSIPLTRYPSAREYLAMAYDPVRRKSVMFGGREDWVPPGGYWSQDLYHNDTWELDAPSREPEIVFGAGGPGGDLDIGSVPETNLVRFGEAPPFTWNAYMQANGELRPAVGDLDGDGAEEIVLGLGSYPQSGGWIAIVDDANHGYALLGWIRVPWSPYNAANGATSPQCGDVDGDGRAEIVVGLGTYPAQGGNCAVFDDASTHFAFLRWLSVPWAAYNAANGETRPAVGDIDGDGRAEVVVGLGSYPSNGGWLMVCGDLTTGFARRNWLRLDSTAYNRYNGGTRPSLGDIDGDGRAEIAIGEEPYPGGGGWVRLLDDAAHGFAPLAWDRIPWAAYVAANGEVRPSIEHVDPGQTAELVCGLGYFPSNGGWVAVFPHPLSGRPEYWARDPETPYDASNGSEWVAPGDLH